MNRVYSFVDRVFFAIIRLAKKSFHFDIRQYWNDRATCNGLLAVYNQAHSKEEAEELDKKLNLLYRPIILEKIIPKDKNVLDFGCGWGRFSGFLQELFPGQIIGVDISSKIIELSPHHYPRCKYKVLHGEKIPIQDNFIDVVFIHLVLGAIPKNNLKKYTAELDRVSNENSLFFIVENTSKNSDTVYWHFHTANEYQELFSFVDLQKVNTYEDVNEEISIFLGRKK